MISILSHYDWKQQLFSFLVICQNLATIHSACVPLQILILAFYIHLTVYLKWCNHRCGVSQSQKAF